MDKIIIAKELISDLTPQHIAELFCNLDSVEQADFFEHCAGIDDRWREEWMTAGQKGFYCHGMQWLEIGMELKKRGHDSRGATVLMDMAANLYLATIDYIDRLNRAA